MKWLLWLVVAAFVLWCANPAWFLFNIAMRSDHFANAFAALVVLIICAGIAFGVVKLLDLLADG